MADSTRRLGARTPALPKPNPTKTTALPEQAPVAPTEKPTRASLRDSFAAVGPGGKPPTGADAQFLETLSRQAFRYFVDQSHPVTG